MRTTLLNPFLFRFKCLAGFSGAYTIPYGVTSIGDRDFVKCSNLTSVTIPDSVTAIGTWAIYGCSSLTSATIPASVTSIDGSAFSGCSSLASILFNGDAPTICSNDVDDIPVAFPNALFDTRAKFYFRPGTSGWGTTPKEKMIFRSEDEFEAYVDKHPDETFCWMMGEDYKIVPGDAAPATETAALEANPERPERAWEEASGNARASSVEVNAARVKESDGPDGTPRYRLSRDIELGLVTPDTGEELSEDIIADVYADDWNETFVGKVFNPDQFAERILALPPAIAEEYIGVADALVTHLMSNPASKFNVGSDYGSMGPAIRDAFQARWFKDH